MIENEGSDERLVLPEAPPSGSRPPSRGDWLLMVVDDEEDVHRVTRLVLNRFRFQGRGLRVLSAYSAAEARKMAAETPGLAVMILDVVMEEPDAGLKLVRYLRENLKNRMTRIILRTGQPGQAPEGRVIMDYDINDYKSKTELTEERLLTAVVAALRSYSDLAALERNRRGLERIIEGAANVFEPQSLRRLTSGILMQLAALFSLDNDALFCRISGLAATAEGDAFKVVSGTGKYADSSDRDIRDVLPPDTYAAIAKAASERRNLVLDGGYVCFFRSSRGSDNVAYVEGLEEPDATARALVDVFCSSAAVAFDNVYLNMEVEESQREIIFTLGDIVDRRSRETGHHVRRVGEFSRLLGLLAGLDEPEANMLRIASSMHDIGKLGIPDIILDKRDFLHRDEFETMKSHARIGADMLQRSGGDLLRAAALIALQHHERWDGTGYPGGLRGEEIHLYARITAIADVFDALSHDRVYRKALGRQEIIDYFRFEDRDKFDPHLLELFLEHSEEFFAIQEKFNSDA